VKLEVLKRTERCAATNVDPDTGKRDMAIPVALQRAFGHTDFGIYARVTADGILALGDEVSAPAS
jgi:MOSC domain-containing protein